MDQGLRIIESKKRKNGFELPLNIFQVLVYFVFILNIVIYFLVTVNFIDFWAIHILSAVLLIGSVTSGFFATSTDPEDLLVQEQKSCEENNLVFDDSKYDFYCNIC